MTYDRYGESEADDDFPDDYAPTQAELAEHQTREKASLKIACRYCGAQPNQKCVNKNTGEPAEKFTAHTIRITDADTVTPIREPDDDEVPF